MPRLLGVDIRGEKRIDVALRDIYGVGPVNSKEILRKANIDASIRAKDLNEQQLSQIAHAVQVGKLVTEGDLRQLRSEEHTSELQSLRHLVCRLLLEKKKKKSSLIRFRLPHGNKRNNKI